MAQLTDELTYSIDYNDSDSAVVGTLGTHIKEYLMIDNMSTALRIDLLSSTFTVGSYYTTSANGIVSFDKDNDIYDSILSMKRTELLAAELVPSGGGTTPVVSKQKPFWS